MHITTLKIVFLIKFYTMEYNFPKSQCKNKKDQFINNKAEKENQKIGQKTLIAIRCRLILL